MTAAPGAAPRAAPGEPALPGVDPREQASLARLGVRTLDDLLFWFPRWHVNKARLASFATAPAGERAFFMARISRVGIFVRGRLHIIRVQLDDGTGRADLYWFNRPYLASEYRSGRTVILHDAPERGRSTLRFSGQAGTCEAVSEDDAKRIAAGETLVFYRVTTVFGQDRARQFTAAALKAGLPGLKDHLPEAVREGAGLPGLRDAVRNAHAPAGWTEWEGARRRIVFDRLFLLQVALARERKKLEKVRKARAYVFDGEKRRKFTASLPFTLTGAQVRSLDEVLGDMARDCPMNRLLQGDVGSGKTVIAAAAIAVAADSGFQSAVMAPTEILAEQHFHTFRRLLGPAGIRVGLLVSGMGKGERRQLKAGLEGSYFDLVVGTHALIEPDVEMPRLALAVIDERHKFGVRQRAALEKKAKNPDVLTMTATPLPRALVLTQYGDTSLSLVDEMPPGRGGITTTWSNGAFQRDAAYRFVAQRLELGERAFAVFPLVEESEALILRDAVREFERLKKAFPKVNLGLIHGRLSTDEKEKAMAAFASGEVRLLVCTTVIEVGIDIPEATVMLVEHADRFGLAQLHQLRGRIGRGPRPSWCFLVSTGRVTADAQERLKTMVATTNGFELAEKDLALRGPGELLGLRQHGAMEWEHLDLLNDADALVRAREEAGKLVAADPELRKAEGRAVAAALKSRLGDAWDLVKAS